MKYQGIEQSDEGWPDDENYKSHWFVHVGVFVKHCKDCEVYIASKFENKRIYWYYYFGGERSVWLDEDKIPTCKQLIAARRMNEALA